MNSVANSLQWAAGYKTTNEETPNLTNSLNKKISYRLWIKFDFDMSNISEELECKFKGEIRKKVLSLKSNIRK